MEVELRNKARKYLERMNEPLVIEPADAEETAMIEEGMREYEKDPTAFTPWKTVKKEMGLA